MEEDGVPEVVLTSPTCSRVGSGSTTGTIQGLLDAMREDGSESEDVGVEDFHYGRGNNGGGFEGEGGGGRKRYLPYRPPPPPPTSPSPPSSPAPFPSPPSPSPAPSDDDIIAQAVTLKIIHFASRSPPPPVYPAPAPLPPSPTISRPTATTTTISTIPTSKTPAFEPTTTDGTITEPRTRCFVPPSSSTISSNKNTTTTTEPKPPSPSPSLLSNASSIVRLIESGVVDFSTLQSTGPTVRGIGVLEDEGVEKEKGVEERWKRLTLDTAGWLAFGAGGWGF
ncbi:MAG: hypothetical protein LQ349_004854 [Xanthoria aureola]|nr:MAG: hypothetical protein LQ349_004854 [Xanthoria aureola]